MPRKSTHDDDWKDDSDHWGDGSEDYDNDSDDYDNLENDDSEPTVPCPYCRREILEDAPRCPYCERYISEEDAPASRKPWWIVGGVALCLYVVYRWIAG